MPQALHGQLVSQAELEGVSLNQYVVFLLTEGTAYRQVMNYGYGAGIGGAFGSAGVITGLDATRLAGAYSLTGASSFTAAGGFVSAGSPRPMLPIWGSITVQSTTDTIRLFGTNRSAVFAYPNNIVQEAANG
jgi:hypothetical protein